VPALFLAFLQRWHQGTLPYAYQDQAMDPAVAHAICVAPDPVASLCAEPLLWGEVAGHPLLVESVRRASERVRAFVDRTETCTRRS
jgi:D-arabinitol 4-dehydrogenase